MRCDWLRAIFTEDDPALQGAPGVSVLGVRQDASGSPVNASGDYQNFIFDGQGNLKVNTGAVGASSTYIAAFTTIAVGGAGNAIEIIGSATKTVKIIEVFLSKPDVTINVILRKQSAASTGGTSTTPTCVPLDSANAAATAVVRAYTVVPSAGALVGNVYSDNLDINEKVSIQFTSGQALTLNAAAQALAINVDGAVNLTGFIKWIEY